MLYSIARFLLIAGIVLLFGAGLAYLAAKFGLPLGRLPGDILIKRGNGTIYIPITTSILVSVILTILANLVIRLFR
jgi:hypothetical protein